MLTEGQTLNPHPKTSEYLISQGSKADNRGGFAAFTFPQYTLVTPQKFCISIVSNFSWDLQSSQENFKTVLMQFFFWGGGGGGEIGCIMVNVKVVNQGIFDWGRGGPDFGSETTVELFGGKLLLTEKTSQEPINFVDGLLDHMFLNL